MNVSEKSTKLCIRQRLEPSSNRKSCIDTQPEGQIKFLRNYARVCHVDDRYVQDRIGIKNQFPEMRFLFTS